MSRFIVQLAACLLVFGFLLVFPCAGVRVRSDAEGMWLFIGPLHWASGATLLAGSALTLVAALSGSKNPPVSALENPPLSKTAQQ